MSEGEREREGSKINNVKRDPSLGEKTILLQFFMPLRRKSNQNFIAPFVTLLECSMFVFPPMLWFIFATPPSTASAIGLINGFAFCAHRFVTIQ